MRRALWFFLVFVGSSYFMICFIAAGIDWWTGIRLGSYQQNPVDFLLDTLALLAYTYVLYFFVYYRKRHVR